MTEQKRDQMIRTARNHGWDLTQWSEDGTTAQMVWVKHNWLYVLEIGLNGVAVNKCWA